MARGKFVGYLRVSTEKQGQSGFGLEAQRKAIEDYLNGGRWELLAEYVEIESGKRSDRPELAKAIAHSKATGATLVIAKLDRLSRAMSRSFRTSWKATPNSSRLICRWRTDLQSMSSPPLPSTSAR
jgi:DNA invertase Pin-like site-specific DNA recombinase